MYVVSIFLSLIRLLIIGISLGVAFIKLELFDKLRCPQIVIIGIAVTPMFLSLEDYILGLFFVGFNRCIYYLIPLLSSAIYLCYKNNRLVFVSVLKESYNYSVEIFNKTKGWFALDAVIGLSLVFVGMCVFCNNGFISAIVKPIIVSLNVVGRIVFISLIILLLLFGVHIVMKMMIDGSIRLNIYFTLIIFVAIFEICYGLSLNGMPLIGTDRAHYQLEARYFSEDRNSWEVDNYSDEKYGSSQPDDHGPLWVVYLADAQMNSDMLGVGDSIRTINFVTFWVYGCFILLLYLISTVLANAHYAGVIALLLFHLYGNDVLMLYGSRDAFRFVGLLSLVIYLYCFYPKITTGIVKWYDYLFLLLFCFLSMNGHEGNAFIMLGLFAMIFLMLIIYKVGISKISKCAVSVMVGTVLGAIKTIVIYIRTGRIQSSTSLPFHDTPVIQQLAEVSIEKGDWKNIWETYSRSVLFMIVLGLIGLFVMIFISIKQRDKNCLLAGVMFLGMLLPLTGIMNWTGYEVSRWFISQSRYRMYFLMIFAITGSWMLSRQWRSKYIRYVCVLGIIVLLTMSSIIGYQKTSGKSQYIKKVISETEDFRRLADKAAQLTTGDVFTRNESLLYYLHGTPKLLYHIRSEPLIQAQTDDEIEEAIEELNIGAIILPEDGVEYHDYSLLPFWKYINESETFCRVKDSNTGYTIFYKI